MRASPNVSLSTGSAFLPRDAATLAAPFSQKRYSRMISALKFKAASNSNYPISEDTFDAFLRAIWTDTPEKKRCRELKAAHAEATRTGDAKKISAAKDAYDAAKSKVPPWLIGARLNGTRNNANVIAEGYVTADFDDVPDCEKLKGTLSLCPHVLLAAQSLGGRGVFCVIPTTPEIQKSPEKIKTLWQELSNYTGIPIGAKDTEGAHIDSACSDAARLRFESYDPTYFYNPDASRWKSFRELAYECYMGSRLFDIAQCFGGAPDSGRENSNARNAFALAAISMIARARVYGESAFLRGRYFPFKAQTVVLGRSGSNKSVTLDALHAVASAFAVREVLSASDASLIDAVAKSAAASEGKGENMTWTPRREPFPILEVIDEAGDDKAARKGREYTSQAADIRRRLFNEMASLSNALSRPAPGFPVRSAYTNIQLSTPERWAESSNAGDGAAGDARRVAEFWMPTPLDDAETTDPIVIGRLMRLSQANAEPPSVDRLIDLLSGLELRGELRLSSAVSDWALDGALPFLGGASREETALNVTAYQTLAVSFATAFAYARGAERICDCDFLAGTSLFLGVLETRKRLFPLAIRNTETQQSAITEMILRTVRASGSFRLDKLKKKCASPDFARVLKELVNNGVLVQFRGMDAGQKRTMLREATDDEIAQREDAMPDFSDERANRDKVARNNAELARRDNVDRGGVDFGPYADCAPDEKRSRVLAYIEKYRLGHPLCPGSRNNGLWELRVLLQRRNNMWDDVAQRAFIETAQETGLPDREIKLLMRANIDGINPIGKPG